MGGPVKKPNVSNFNNFSTIIQTNSKFAKAQNYGTIIQPQIINQSATLDFDLLSNHHFSKSTRNIQQVEREWLDRYQVERERHHTRERDTKKVISQLNSDLQTEQVKLNTEITKSQKVKKTNQ